MCEFDAALMLLRHQKVRLDMELKMGDLHQLTLYQELLLLQEFESRESGLQEKLDGHLREENSITVRDRALRLTAWQCETTSLSSKYGHFCLQKKQDGDGQNPSSALQKQQSKNQLVTS